MDAHPSFVQSYRQVEQFVDDDDEYEQIDGEVVEDIEYVTLDLGVTEPTLVPSSTAYRLIGLDTPTPFLQLSGTVFKGEHQELLGTELLFTDLKGDQSERNKKALHHVANTERRIRFKEVELKGPGRSIAHEEDQAKISLPADTPSAAKKKKARTMEQVVGHEHIKVPRRGRGSTKGKDQGVLESTTLQTSRDTTPHTHVQQSRLGVNVASG